MLRASRAGAALTDTCSPRGLDDDARSHSRAMTRSAKWPPRPGTLAAIDVPAGHRNGDGAPLQELGDVHVAHALTRNLVPPSREVGEAYRSRDDA
jgi:hypothetical protein